MEAARLRQVTSAVGGGGGALAGLPIGFRFRPTDEELLLHYLRRKALACPLPADIIPVADLARLHPWDLVQGDADEERFFFHLPATKCWRRGGGASRAAGTGAWRASGKEKLVVSPRCKRPVGTKRTLVFCHRGGRRSDWLMHEYRLLPAALAAGNPHQVTFSGAADWVVCRIFKRTKPSGRGGRGRDDAEEEIPSSPSSASSCVTAEMEMALQDAMKVCNPDIKTPFQSVEDAVNRLLPYHVVADYEAEEDDRILDSDATGQIPSRLQQWDHNILVKIAEFTTTFEKQVLAYNIMTKKRAIGEFRSEERLMLEQALLQEEKMAMMELRAEMESREKAGREAAEAKMRMAMAEHARAEAQAHSEMMGQGPIRASVAASQGDDGPNHGMAQEQGGDEGWENAQRDDEDPSEDFLNDENENGNSDGQEDWRRSGELDLNSR